MAERRQQPRVPSDLTVSIWGYNEKGSRFLQQIRARNISESGALLVGIEQELRCGDLVGVQYENRQARFKVVWTRNSESALKIEAAVQKLRADECPWKRVLEELAAGSEVRS